MRKRGAKIRHKCATAPGIIVQHVDREYLARLQIACMAINGGWMEVGHFNELVDTLDMLNIGISIYARQKRDESTEVAIEVCRDALEAIQERHAETGKFEATEDEIKAVELLVRTSIDFWNRRSLALYTFAYNELLNVRASQQEEEKEAA